MDFSKFKTSDWLKTGGAVAFLIFGLFPWTKVSAFGFSESGDNVFDFFFTGIIPWLLIIGTGVVSVLLLMGKIPKSSLPWPVIMLAATGLAALLLLLRLVVNPYEVGGFDLDGSGVDVGRAFGMYLSVLSGLAVFAGAFLGFKESGGDINDLTDVNKLKSQFNVGGGAPGSTPPPPPPPASSTPPPPPPPPAGAMPPPPG